MSCPAFYSASSQICLMPFEKPTHWIALPIISGVSSLYFRVVAFSDRLDKGESFKVVHPVDLV